MSETQRDLNLVVLDDEEPILECIQRLLRKEAYSTHVSPDPHEALALVRDRSPQVIISDFRMEKMNGVEFLRQASLLQPGCVRVLLSGFADPDTVRKALSEGVVHVFVDKPWDPAALKRQVQEYFDRHAASLAAGSAQRAA